jgi:hypothetical protein
MLCCGASRRQRLEGSRFVLDEAGQLVAVVRDKRFASSDSSDDFRNAATDKRKRRLTRTYQVQSNAGREALSDLICALAQKHGIAIIKNFEEDVQPEWSHRFLERDGTWADPVSLCSSWLFRCGAPSHLMERITVGVLKKLVDFDNTDDHRLEFLACNLSSMVIVEKVLLPDVGTPYTEPVWASSEIFVGLADAGSEIFMGSPEMTDLRGQKLVACVKGFVGDAGEPIWRGAFDPVVQSIRAIVSKDVVNIQDGICPECLVCPTCMQTMHPRRAATLDREEVKPLSAAAVWCMYGHHINRKLICGETRAPFNHSATLRRECVAFNWRRSVVVVRAEFADGRREPQLSSGFVADSTNGYIVTVAHTVKCFSQDLSAMRIFIGVHLENGDVEFCFTAEIVVVGNASKDAAVLKITGRVPDTPEVSLSDLPDLTLATESFMGENVTCIGYNQEGEGIVPPGTILNLQPDFLRGYVCKQFTFQMEDGSTREEIVVDGGRVIAGHSGGPCLTASGEVLGILSRTDCYNGHRWFLVPFWTLRSYLEKANELGRTQPTVTPGRLRGWFGTRRVHS